MYVVFIEKVSFRVFETKIYAKLNKAVAITPVIISVRIKFLVASDFGMNFVIINVITQIETLIAAIIPSNKKYLTVLLFL